MRLLRRARLWVRSLVRPRQTDRDLDDELRYHLDCQVRTGIDTGLSPEEARTAALRVMGDVTQNQEACRDARGLNPILAIQRNVRFGLRMLVRSPGFTVLALATLALGIGANTALFSVVDAVLLRPMPYRDPDRVVVIFAQDRRPSAHSNVLRGAAGASETGLSVADLEDFKARSRTFAGFASATGFLATMTGPGEPSRINGQSVTPNFFALLGVRPELGNDFAPDDDALKGSRTIILSRELWQQRWRGDRNVIGQMVDLDGISYRIAGVLPAGFRTPHGLAPELFRAVRPQGDATTRGRRFWATFGRIQSNLQPARTELSAIAGRLAEEFPATNRDIGVTVNTLAQMIPGRVRAGLIALMISVGLLLLMACSNLANLLLMRTTGREREIATRKALGASGSQLFQQFLTENLLVAAMGGVLGLLMGTWLIHVIAGLSTDIPRAGESRLDWRVLAFTFAATLFSGLFFTFIPIARSIRKDVAGSLSTRTGGGDRANFRLSNVLVVAQIGIAVLLLIESGLMLRSFAKLQSVDPGFAQSGLQSFQISLSRSQFRGPEHSASLFAALVDRLRSVPGVESAGGTLQLPIAGLDVDLTQIGIPEHPLASDQEPTTRLHVVTPDYFATLGVPLVRGRFFTDADGANSQGVAIVNQAMARKIWGSDDPVGKRIIQRLMFMPGEKPGRVIVGVVGNVKHFGLEFEDEAQMYIPHRQSPYPAMYFVVRAKPGARLMESQLKQAVWAVDPGLPVEKMSTMESVIAQSMAQPRLRTMSISAFAAIAILLAAVGIYGVVSYRVARRRREMAIRMAMGAGRGQVMKLVAGDGAKLALCGAIAGCIMARLAAPAVSGLLYGVAATDGSVIVSAAVLGIGVAVVACLLPARRATRVEPMETLRLD